MSLTIWIIRITAEIEKACNAHLTNLLAVSIDRKIEITTVILSEDALPLEVGCGIESQLRYRTSWLTRGLGYRTEIAGDRRLY